MTKLIRRVMWWLRSRREEAELAEEMAFHEEMKSRELRDSAAARREMGNLTRMREESRAVWLPFWLGSIAQDAAYGLRGLRQQPGFAALAIGVLAVTMGLNTSLFTLFNAVALRPWPVADPGRVVSVYSVRDRDGRANGFSIPEYRYLSQNAKSLSGMIAVREFSVQLDANAPKLRAAARAVSGNYFDVLGVRMQLGRGFLPEEDRLESPQPVAVLSHAAWRTLFNEETGVVGRRIVLDDVAVTVVGVASEDFTGTDPAPMDLWIPLPAMMLLRPNDPATRNWLHRADHCCSTVAGRLAPGATREQANAELDVLSHRFRADTRLDTRAVLLSDTALLRHPQAERQFGPILSLLFLAVTTVLLLACANVGNLLLARAAARRREIAVRLSLGASRRRIVRQLLTESLVLAGLAGALGILLAYWLPGFVARSVVDDTPSIRLQPDVTVLAYVLVLCVIACLAFGLAPALHGTRLTLANAMKDEKATHASRLRLRSVLLGVQVMLSVVLLAGAALLLRGVERARTLDPGFVVAGVSVMNIELPASAYSKERLEALTRDLAVSLRNQPAGLTALAPLSNSRMGTGYRLPGEPEGRSRRALFHNITERYFDILGIPLLAGRNFSSGDTGRKMVLINETLARQLPSTAPVIGQTLLFSEPHEVIGIVKDAHTTSLDRIEPTAYFGLSGSFVPRILFRPSELHEDQLRAQILKLEPRARVTVTPLARNLDEWLRASRAGATIAGVLGGFALLLAAVGVAGVFGYTVEQRRKEIGIRMALGAQPFQVIRLVVRFSAAALAGGLIVGLAAAAGMSALIRGQLYGLSRFDPVSYGLVVAILIAAGLAAAYIPARRATRIDPIATLRWE